MNTANRDTVTHSLNGWIKERFLANAVVTPLASKWLDAIRAGAAGIVVVNHIRALFFVNWDEVARPNLLNRALYFLASLGHVSVMVFFVLSGYFIAGSVFRAYFSNRWSWRTYLIHRLTRLCIVLFPALVLTLFWDRLGIFNFGSQSVYAGLPSDQFIIFGPVEARGDIKTLVGNALFLQSIFVPAFGSNGPLWSLSYEFWYYIAFPFAFFLLMTHSWRQRVACGAALILLAFLCKGAIAWRFLVWLLGVVVLLLPQDKRPQSRGITLATIGAASLPFLTLCVLQRNTRLESVIDFLVGGSVALFLYVIVRAAPTLEQKEATTNQASAKKSLPHQAAAFSYTLYLTHMPLLVFLHGWAYQQNRMKWQPDPRFLLYAVGLACLAIAYAWAIAQVTEARTDVARRKIQSLLLR